MNDSAPGRDRKPDGMRNQFLDSKTVVAMVLGENARQAIGSRPRRGQRINGWRSSGNSSDLGVKKWDDGEKSGGCTLPI